jgi:hypothetical protein
VLPDVRPGATGSHATAIRSEEAEVSTTIEQICQDIPTLHESGNWTKGQGSVIDGLKPRKISVSVKDDDVKAIWLSPEEALTVIIPTVSVNGRVIGYQREFSRPHARRVANDLKAGKVFPPVNLAQDGNGKVFGVDGQHRLAAAVIAREPVLAVVRRLTKEQQKQLFGDQRKARSVDRNVLILAGTSPYERYIQDAVATDRHPWGRLASANTSSKTRLTPYQMLHLLTSYVGNSLGATLNKHVLERWDQELADELAPLIACFGNKQDNPAAFRPPVIRGIGDAAMFVFRRNDAVQASDHERWVRHMPGFKFNDYLFIRTHQEMTYRLVGHWNKKLFEARKVSL